MLPGKPFFAPTKFSADTVKENKAGCKGKGEELDFRKEFKTLFPIKVAPQPTKVFIEGMSTAVSSTRKINHVKKMKNWVTTHEMRTPMRLAAPKNRLMNDTSFPNR